MSPLREELEGFDMTALWAYAVSKAAQGLGSIWIVEGGEA